MRASIIIVVAIVLVLLVVAWCIPNRLADVQWFRSDASIRAGLLRAVPVGTPFAEVRSYFERTFRVRQAMPDTHAVDQHGRPLGGRGYLRVHLGGYWLVFRIDVEAIAAFDDDGRLRDVLVFKTTDAL